MKKTFIITLLCISILHAEKLEIPAFDIVTQLRHIASKLKIKGIFIAPNINYVPKYSRFWGKKFVSNSSQPSDVINEFFSKKTFKYRFDHKTNILYVDVVDLNKTEKKYLSENIKNFRAILIKKEHDIVIIRKAGNDFFTTFHKFPPSFDASQFLANLKKIKALPMESETYENYIDVDYVVYPIVYFMTFQPDKLISILEADNIFSVRDVSYKIKLQLWEQIYQNQNKQTLDYLIKTFYEIKCPSDLEGIEDTLIREKIAEDGFIPNPKIYNGRYAVNGPFSNIMGRIYQEFPYLAVQEVDKELVEFYQSEIKKIFIQRFGIKNLSERQLYVLENLSKVSIKFWPDYYRTIRINSLFELDDQLDYLIDMAKNVDKLKDWFLLVTIKGY